MGCEFLEDAEQVVAGLRDVVFAFAALALGVAAGVLLWRALA